MAKQAVGPISIGHQLEVMQPAKEPAIPVPLTRWRQFMQRIRDCADNSNKYESIGWACIGASVTALFSAITFVASVDFEKKLPSGEVAIAWWKVGVLVACVAATVATGFGGWLSLTYAKQHRKDRADLREIILEDMQFIENMHPATPSSPAATGATAAVAVVSTTAVTVKAVEDGAGI